MNNFHKLSRIIYAGNISDELHLRGHLWGQFPHRTDLPGSAHGDVLDIWLRYPEIEGATAEQVFNELECVNYQGFFELPAARNAIFEVSRIVGGERIGRCLITKLKPGGKISPHIDEGPAPQYYDRFHLVVESNPESKFMCGDESVVMKPNEIWWFDNKKTHSVTNDGEKDRVHLIMDIKISR
jgi:hypothetical protein